MLQINLASLIRGGRALLKFHGPMIASGPLLGHEHALCPATERAPKAKGCNEGRLFLFRNNKKGVKGI